MIHEYLEIAGAMAGALVTFALFAMNIFGLIFGRRFFRRPRSWRMK